MNIKIILIVLVLVFTYLSTNKVFADSPYTKFGQGFKLETPGEICPETLLNLKSQSTSDNFTNNNIDPIKKTFNLNIMHNNISTKKTNDESLSFRKIDEAPPGTSSMFPDREFRGSHSPDFCGTALGLTFGD